MNIEQSPRATEFCADFQPYIIDSDATIGFQMRKADVLVLDESYVPDADSKITIRDIGRVCQQALWGVWPSGSITPQSYAYASFSFYFNEVFDRLSRVIFSRARTRRSADSCGVLSQVTQKVTRLGAQEWASGFPLSSTTIANVQAVVDGEVVGGTIRNSDYSDIVSVEVSPETVATLLGIEAGAMASYSIQMANGTITFLMDRQPLPQWWMFRCKNVYDMPETLLVRESLTVKGANKSTTDAMFGIERKFDVQASDEYTARSGHLRRQDEYLLWRDLLNAQEVQVWSGADWFPIIVTSQKFERDFRRNIVNSVEFSFKLADPTQADLFEYDQH